MRDRKEMRLRHGCQIELKMSADKSLSEDRSMLINYNNISEVTSSTYRNTSSLKDIYLHEE